MPKRPSETSQISPKRSTADAAVATAISGSDDAGAFDLVDKLELQQTLAVQEQLQNGFNAAAEKSSVSSSPPSPASCTRPPPRTEQSSPTNRDKFLAGLYVQTVGCCLDSCTAGPNVRLTFKGTVVVLYPVNHNPDRRYVIFMDEDGNTGITIWNANLRKISTDSIGKMCEITKVNLCGHQGKTLINLSKDSEVRSN